MSEQCPKCGSDRIRYDDDRDDDGNIEQAWYTCDYCLFQWSARLAEGNEIPDA